MTAYSPPSEAIFYNPAGLAFKGVSIQIAATGFQADEKSTKKAKELRKEDSINSREIISENLSSEDITMARGGTELLNLVFPYFGLKTFGSAKVTSKRVSDTQDFDFRLRLGGIVGLAFSSGNFSFGYSAYILKEANVESNPTTTQIDEIDSASQNNNLESVDFSSYTTANYGETTGHNIGFIYKFGKADNPSALGLSVLNLGGAKFTERSNLRGSFTKLEDEARDEASKLGITLTRPDKIEQMINTGLHFSTNQGKDDYFLASFSLDYQDIGGSTLKNKLSMASELGVRLSDNLALLTSVPVFKHQGFEFYVGLTSLKLIGGYRPRESLSGGVNIELHSGVNKLFSIIRGNISLLAQKSLDKKLLPNSTGFRLGLGLTFILVGDS